MPTRVSIVVLAAVLPLAAPRGASTAEPAAGQPNLVVNGDFEQASTSGPPPGWTMWGASKYKLPANYARDTDQPHSGAACFRIHHPAGTAGYVVSAPESAIRPKPGMTYSVSFWARTDRPGEAMFGWDAYRQIRPFIEAPSPGLFPFPVERQWKQYRFMLHEGWDFFAEECRYLLLIFKAAGRAEEERTLWIDDAVVTEGPSPRKDRLVNPDTLTYPHLEHRLAAGEDLAIVIDADKRLGEARRELGGVSFHRVAGWTKLPYDKEGRYVLPAELEEAIREIRLPMTRFYALGEEPFGLEAAIDKAAEFCRKIGVPQAATPLEFEIQGATKRLSPEVWSRGVKHSLDQGYAFRHWEVTNEPYVGRPGRAFVSADDFLEHFLAVSRAIRQVHPDTRIGMPIYHASPAWGNYLLKRAAGDYDFVVGHYYVFADVYRSSFEDIVLTANYRVLDEILKVNALLRLYNPGRQAWQYDTEWGMHCSGRQGQRADSVARNANIFGMMHRAVRLIHYLREGMLRGASSWEMFSYQREPGFGLFARDAPHLRSMNYWLYYYFNRHVGRWVLAIDGTAPYHEGKAAGREYRGPLTPAVATLSEDGRQMRLVLANGSWERAVPCRIETRHFPAHQARATALSHADPDGSPYLQRKEELVRDLPVTLNRDALSMTLPPHTVVFLTLER
jgi:hypothetical protein